MKNIALLLARGAALGLFAGLLFIIFQVINAYLTADVEILERIYLFSTLYLGESQVNTYNSFELTTSLLFHLIFSMVIGVVFVNILKIVTRFSKWQPTVLASVVMGVFFWLILFYFIEPVILGSTLLEEQTNLSKQLLIQAIIFTVFGIVAQAVFKKIEK